MMKDNPLKGAFFLLKSPQLALSSSTYPSFAWALIPCSLTCIKEGSTPNKNKNTNTVSFLALSLNLGREPGCRLGNF
jgi:hypothetical protein